MHMIPDKALDNNIKGLAVTEISVKPQKTQLYNNAVAENKAHE